MATSVLQLFHICHSMILFLFTGFLLSLADLEQLLIRFRKRVWLELKGLSTNSLMSWKNPKAYICLVVFRQYLIGCVFSFEMVVIREPHINSMHTDNHQCFQSKTQFIFLLGFLFSYHPSVSVVSLSPPVFVFLYPLLFSFACFCFLLLTPLTTITAGTFLSCFIVCCMMILFIYLFIFWMSWGTTIIPLPF